VHCIRLPSSLLQSHLIHEQLHTLRDGQREVATAPTAANEKTSARQTPFML
jgi:hypothetical protein